MKKRHTRSETADIIPVLLGADLNCYSVARAFYEAYGVRTQAFGKYALGVTKNSRFIHFTAESHLDDPVLCVKLLLDFAADHPNTPLILMGCTDEYAAFLITNRAQLEGSYYMPYMDAALMPSLVDKADFYESCQKYGIPYPKTAIFAEVPEEQELNAENLGFDYPVIVKPSSSIDYWRHPFEGMKKVYVADTPKEAHDIIEAIKAAGYPARIVVQDKIPGGDDHMRVLTAYSDKNGHVKMMCLGHVLLEEHTPKGLGNHAAIITEALPDVAECLRAMLNDMGIRGFTNFDMKMDDRDGSFKVFEINLRQGRSNHYLTAADINIARLVTEDYVFGEEIPEVKGGKEIFWHSVPKKVVYRYVEDDALVDKARALDRQGRSASPFFSRHDLCMNLPRLVFVLEHLRRQHGKYATYCRRMR